MSNLSKRNNARTQIVLSSVSLHHHLDGRCQKPLWKRYSRSTITCSIILTINRKHRDLTISRVNVAGKHVPHQKSKNMRLGCVFLTSSRVPAMAARVPAMTVGDGLTYSLLSVARKSDRCKYGHQN